MEIKIHEKMVGVSKNGHPIWLITTTNEKKVDKPLEKKEASMKECEGLNCNGNKKKGVME